MYLANSLLTKSPVIEGKTAVKLVLYSIDTTFIIPFIKFHLVKDCSENFSELKDMSLIEEVISSSEYLTFPSFVYDPESYHLFSLYCQGVVESLFENNQYISNIELSGHYKSNTSNECYSFFKLTETTTEAEYLVKDSFIWTALIDEILGTKMVCNIPIDSAVTSFFAENKIEFTQVGEVNSETNAVESQYENPIVLYSIVPTKKVEFYAMFGLQKNSDNYYSGSSYHHTLEQYWKQLTTATESTQSKTGGLLRCVFYPGLLTLKENDFKTDPSITCYYSNQTYYIREYERHKILSFHCVSNSKNYNIK